MTEFNEYQFGLELVKLIDDYSDREKTEYNQGYLDALQRVCAAFSGNHYEEGDE